MTAKKQTTTKGGMKGEAEGGDNAVDARVARRLAEIFSRPDEDGARGKLFEELTELEGSTHVYAEHPEVVARWYAVAVREARRLIASKQTDKLTRDGLKRSLARVRELAGA